MAKGKMQGLAKDTVVYGIGTAFNQVVGFLLLPLYTRFFDPGEYGVLDMLTKLTTLSAIVISAGMDSALSYYFFKYKEIAERRKTYSSTLFYLILLNVFLASVVWVNAESISSFVFRKPEYANYIRLAVIASPFASMWSAGLNMMRLRRLPTVFVVFSGVNLLVLVTLNIVFVGQLGYGIEGVLYSRLGTMMFFSVVAVCYHYQFLGFNVSFKRLRMLLRYGLPLIVGGLSVWTVESAGRFYLLRYFDENAVGLYSVGAKIAAAVGLISLAFRRANLAFVYENMNDVNAKRIYARTFLCFVVVATMMSVLVSLGAFPLLQVVSREAYWQGSRLVPFLAAGAVLFGLYQISSTGFMVTRRTVLAGVTSIAGPVIVILAMWLLVPLYGILGAAIATTLAHAGVVVTKMLVAQRVYRIPYDFGKSVLVLVVAVACVGIGCALQRGQWFFDGLVAVILTFICGAVLFKLRVLQDVGDNFSFKS